jgi:hypothetical protein
MRHSGPCCLWSFRLAVRWQESFLDANRTSIVDATNAGAME